MNSTHTGDVVTVTFYDTSEGTVNSVPITLSGSGTGYLGVVTTTAGMSLITTDDVMGTALNPFYNRHGISEDITGMLAYIAHPFSGFTPIPEDLQWWFNEPFQGYWAIMCILYWTFWLNILLGITNALPAVPFDGGFIFAGWLDAALERMGKKDREAREKQVDEICKNVSNVMLLLLILVVVVAVV